MDKDYEVGSEHFWTDSHAPLLCGSSQGLGTSDPHKWFSFESVSEFAEKTIPRFQVCLGEGDWKEVKHGTFSRLSEPVSAKEALDPAVVCCWRRLYSRYSYDPKFRRVCVQVSGEVSWILYRGEPCYDWQTALLIKSRLIIQSFPLDPMGRISFLEHRPLAVISK